VAFDKLRLSGGGCYGDGDCDVQRIAPVEMQDAGEPVQAPVMPAWPTPIEIL